MEPTSNNGRTSNEKSASSPSGDFLAEQVADAKVALQATLEDCSLEAMKLADVRRWVRRYPWPAMGAALVAGFTASHFLLSKRQRGKNGADEIDDRDVMDSANPPPASPYQGGEAAATRAARVYPAATATSDGWRAKLLTALFDIVRLAVTQWISASLRSAAASAMRDEPARPEASASAREQGARFDGEDVTPADPPPTQDGSAM